MAQTAFADSGIDSSPFKAAPTIRFVNEKGETRTMDPADSKLTAVHFWATWCVPCVEELGEVDATQKAYEGRLRIISISLDGDGAASMKKVQDFMSTHKILYLTPYLDDNMASYRAAKLRGLPTTLFIDSKGHEIGRAEGALEWSSGEVIRFLDERVK